ncbi:MAG TPA: TetR family transcriptional regulator [Rhizobium sp.]|nr:TetR family transcriptional regulator [Rhizobium sp.]
MRRSNKDRAEATRQILMDHARELFVERGYSETATPDIVAAAGVTRGALYHHFADKRGLFLAVVEREAAQVAAEIAAAADKAVSARDALVRGIAAYFDAMAAPGRSRLLLLDGPAIMGLESGRATDRDHAEASLHSGLEAYLRETGSDLAGLEPVARLLSAAFDRAVLAIAAGESREAYEQAIIRLIDGLVTRQPR